MSYCKFGNESDVYVYASDSGLHCHIVEDILNKNTALDDVYSISYEDEKPEEEMLATLLWLRQQWKLKIPNKVFFKLRNELTKRKKNT